MSDAASWRRARWLLATVVITTALAGAVTTIHVTDTVLATPYVFEYRPRMRSTSPLRRLFASPPRASILLEPEAQVAMAAVTILLTVLLALHREPRRACVLLLIVATLDAAFVAKGIGDALRLLRPYRCVVATTHVATPLGEVSACAVVPGMALIEAPARPPTRVRRATHHLAWGILRLRLSSGRVLAVTRSHPLQVDAGWRTAGELRVGDVLAGVDGPVSVVEIVESTIPSVVVDLEVDPPHTFVAEGVLCHNKTY